MTEQNLRQKKAVIKVTGMSCNHCVQHVEKALQQAKGISAASVDLKAERAYVDYDSSETDTDNLLQVIKNAGYEAALQGN